MANKYNPFRPDKTVPPGMFSGRIPEIDYIQSCLRQTKNGNPKHFIVTGERGIGKSSLVLLEQLSANGSIPYDDGSIFKFIVISVKLRKEDRFFDIVTRVSRELKKQIANASVLSSLILKSIELLSRVEASGFRIHPGDANPHDNEVFASLVDDFEASVLKSGDAYDGILVLLDEADAPSADAHLGLFCKLLTEEMTLRQTDKVCIGLAGLPNLIGKLRDSHESSLRLFHVLNLKPLEPEERIGVLIRGVEEANNKNDRNVQFEKEAQELISRFSEGYPHFLQEFAYCAFENDTDFNIDREDFLQSLFVENGAFDQLGVKYFNKPYNTPSSDDYRGVLHVMAENFDSWITRAEIIERSGLKGGTVDNALRALKAKDIIAQDETKAGRYRIPTRSFATWINIQKKAEEESPTSSKIGS